jgi:parallel beta-helix repeat protein
MNSNFRNSLKDSFGSTFKLSWFAEMDYLMSQGVFVYADGSSAGVSGYTAIRDILANNWGTQIKTYGDSIEYHHHFMIYDGKWERYDKGPDAGYGDYQNYALDQMIIDRHFYPVSFDVGWDIMPPVLSNWLDQWLPFDYTNLGDQWYPTHSSNTTRWAVPDDDFASESGVNAAFKTAESRGSAIYCFGIHDREDMVGNLTAAHNWLVAARSMYPDVSFQYVTAAKAIQLALGWTDFTPPTFTISPSGNAYLIKSNELLWADHPYVALEYSGGTYTHIAAVKIGSNIWTITPQSPSSLVKIGVAASDLFGNSGVHIVKASGTVYIRADGSVDPPDAPISTFDNVTYTLTGNITSNADGIVVERDNIVIDGAGYTVEGTMEGASESKGVDLSSRINVTVTNTKITSFSYSYGIYLYSSLNNSVSGNNITANWWGLLLYSSSNNSISGNNIANNVYGIRLFGSSNNTIAGNVFADGGLSVYNSYGNLVEDNLVNGKPLIYLEGVSDVNVGYAGQVILVNSANVKIENLDISITSAGVQLIKTNNSRISGNTLARNGIGICLIDSLNNSVNVNNITDNLFDGVWLGSSSNNSISENTITNNGNGIWLYYSSNSSISGNTITNNHEYGVWLDSSSNNTVCHNNFINNTFQVNNLTPENANSWDNGCEGNFWGNYNGTDLDLATPFFLGKAPTTIRL